MAQTKVKLIADDVIVQSNLNASHGITTADIGENASYLYYTDARVSSYLSTNGYATQTDIVAAITDSAPVTLDTLNELAAALGDDPNFATTTATSLGLKAPLASPSFTGNAVFAGSVTSTEVKVVNSSATSTLYAESDTLALVQLKDDGLNKTYNIEIGRSSTAGDLTFRSSDGEKVRFTEAGNVGIGVTPSSTNAITTQITNGLSLFGNNSTPYGFISNNHAWTSPGGDQYLVSNYGASYYKQYEGAHSWATAPSGTAGSTATFTTRMTILQGGNVGIGLTNPAVKLEIQDSTHTTMKIRSGNDDNILFAQAIQSSDARIGTDTNTDLSFYSNASERMRIDSSGNIGINGESNFGSSNKAVQLINGVYSGAFQIDSAGNIGLAQNAYQDGAWKYYQTNEAAILNLEDGEFKFFNAASGTEDTVISFTERMRIDSSGNVGIGRTSDLAKKLDVLGAGLRLMDTSSYSSITIGASGWQTTYPYQRLDTFNSDGTGYYWALGHRKTDGTKTIRMLVPDTSTRYVSVIDALYVQSFTSNELGGSGNYPSFSTNVVLSNNGVSYINGGNVGIGTTSPGEKLEVKGNIVINSQSTSSATTELDQLIFRKLHPNGPSSGFYNQASIRSKTFGGYSGGLNFYTNKSLGAGSYGERLAMSIDNFQNVGIGTTSPNNILHVSSAGSDTYVRIGNNAGYDAGLYFNTSTDWTIGTDTSNSNAFTIGNGSSVGTSPKIVIQTGGNVGIGTTSPSTKFQLNSPNAGAVVGGTIGATIYGYSNNEMLVISSRYDQNLGGIRFKRGQAGSEVDSGSITFTASGTSFNTSSDYRLKEDLQDFAGLDMVSKIPVYDFKWKTDKSRSYGVMAHELQEILPLAVTGEKDAEKMQGVDYSKIIPLLVKSIQELKAEIETLKTQING
jgi:hypothetical protein